MEKGKSKYFLNMILLLVLVVGIFYFMVKDQINEVADILLKLGTKEFVALFGITFLNILVSGLLVALLGRKFNKNYSIKDGVSAFLLTNMFGAITPMNIAYYPTAICVYKKQNMNTEESISITAIDLTIKQTFVCIASLFLTIFFINNPMIATIGNHQFNISTLCLIVCAANVIGTICLVGMCVSNKIHILISRIVYFLIRVFYKKNKEEGMQKKFDEKIVEVENALQVVLKNKVLLFKQLILHFVKSMILYATPYILYLLLSENSTFIMNDFIWWYATVMFVVYIASFIPIPGGSVTVEAFATIVLTHAVSMESALLSSLILLWRLFDHYGIIAIGAISMLKPIKKTKRNITTTIIKEMYIEKGLTQETQKTIR